jgi:diaminopimelate decarboxylase
MGLIYQNRVLHFGENNLFPLTELTRGSKAPFYVYDLEGMRSRVRALRQAFPGIRPHFAMKANASDRILRTFHSEGTGVDVVSGGEIRTAYKAGFAPEDVIFSGVGKTREELELAIGTSIQQINIESPQELERVIQISAALEKKPRVAFRYNPDVDAKTHPYISTGLRENKFGMGGHFIPELKQILAKNPGRVEFVGLTMHIGSQLLDLSPLEDAIRKTLEVYRAFQAEGHPLRTLDVGGGLGIPYQEEHRVPSRDFELLAAYGQMLERVLKGFPDTVLCEPGRILVASSGTLLGEVQYVKETPFRNFLILNTGMHHLIRPALYQAFHRVIPVLEHPERPLKTYDIVGPICESSDALGRDRSFHEVLQGEWVAIADAGAYGYAMATTYNEHELPKQYYWENSQLSD